MAEPQMKRVLFVCTGNIFRSLTAEYALRHFLGPDSKLDVSSAGTMDFPGALVRVDVAQYLEKKGLDVSEHQRRTLTTDILHQADLVVSMSTDHRDTLKEHFEYDSILFTEACGYLPKPLPDVDDLFLPEERHGPEAWVHICHTIDEIIEGSQLISEKVKSGWQGAI